MNENEQSVQGQEASSKKVVKQKTVAIKPAKKIEVEGRVARKLGCFSSDKERDNFIDKILRNLPNEEYIKFKSEYAVDQNDLDLFVKKLESCDVALKF